MFFEALAAGMIEGDKNQGNNNDSKEDVGDEDGVVELVDPALRVTELGVIASEVMVVEVFLPLRLKVVSFENCWNLILKPSLRRQALENSLIHNEQTLTRTIQSR